MNVFGLDEKLPQLTRKPLNLDVGKLEVVNERFKIALQLGTIQFEFLLLLTYCCRFVMD
jgi:hypothetical protein